MIKQNTQFDQQLNAFFQQNNWLGIIRLMEDQCQPGGDLWDDAAALSTYGFALTQQQQWSKAREVFFRCIDLEPDRAKHYYSMGYIDYMQANWEKAIHWFDEALSRYPKYFVVLYRKGYALYMWDKASQAKPVLRQAQEIFVTHADEDWQRRNRKYYMKVRFTLGRVLLKLKEAHAALREFQYLLQEDKREVISRQFLLYEVGKTYLALKEFQRAEQYLIQASKIRPVKDFILDQLGRVYHAQGRYDKAIQVYRRAFEFRRQAYILVNMAQTMQAQGNLQEAMQVLQRALKRDVNHKMTHQIYLRMGKIAMQQEDLDRAEWFFQKAIQAKVQYYQAQFAEGYYALVFCYLKLGHKDRARDALQTALAINPQLEWDRRLLEVLDDGQSPLPDLIDVVMN